MDYIVSNYALIIRDNTGIKVNAPASISTPDSNAPEIRLFDTDKQREDYIKKNNLIGVVESVEYVDLSYQEINNRDELKAWINENGLSDYVDMRKSLDGMKGDLSIYYENQSIRR
jgi:hypothetical protein